MLVRDKWGQRQRGPKSGTSACARSPPCPGQLHLTPLDPGAAAPEQSRAGAPRPLALLRKRSNARGEAGVRVEAAQAQRRVALHRHPRIQLAARGARTPGAERGRRSDRWPPGSLGGQSNAKGIVASAEPSRPPSRKLQARGALLTALQLEPNAHERLVSQRAPFCFVFFRLFFFPARRAVLNDDVSADRMHEDLGPIQVYHKRRSIQMAPGSSFTIQRLSVFGKSTKEDGKRSTPRCRGKSGNARARLFKRCPQPRSAHSRNTSTFRGPPGSPRGLVPRPLP